MNVVIVRLYALREGTAIFHIDSMIVIMLMVRGPRTTNGAFANSQTGCDGRPIHSSSCTSILSVQFGLTVRLIDYWLYTVSDGEVEEVFIIFAEVRQVH